jgi:hypothetical protein
MVAKPLCVLQPFLAFGIQFDATTAHNMMALMLDPRCKGLKCVTNLIGKDRTQVLMEEWNKIKFGSVFNCNFQVP